MDYTFKNTFFVTFFSLLVISNSKSPARATDLFNFENTPGGITPVDNAFLNNAYSLTGGGTVRFFFDNNLNGTYDAGDERPVFEQTGTDGEDGFLATQGAGPGNWDRARTGYQPELGDFFLRESVALTVPGPFVIRYNTTQTITEFSGEIWDIDGSPSGTEQWRVEALNAAGQVLASIDSPLGDSASISSLDSLPWVFGFTNLPAGFQSARLTFTGTKTTGVGLALNNFSPATSLAPPVPEPSSFILTSIACAVAAMCRYRKYAGQSRQASQ